MEQEFPRKFGYESEGSFPQCRCGRLMKFATVYEDIRPIESRYFYRLMDKFYCECGNEVAIVSLEESKEISARAFETFRKFKAEYAKWDGDLEHLEEVLKHLPNNWDEL